MLYDKKDILFNQPFIVYTATLYQAQIYNKFVQIQIVSA